MYVYYFSTSEWKMGKEMGIWKWKEKENKQHFYVQRGDSEEPVAEHWRNLHFFTFSFPAKKAENPQQGAREYSKQNTQERRVV